jgi:hypothetical protein
MNQKDVLENTLNWHVTYTWDARMDAVIAMRLPA